MKEFIGILVLILAPTIAVLLGRIEAWLFKYKYSSKYSNDEKNLHPLFVALRVVIVVVVFLPLLLVTYQWEWFLLIGYVVLQFSFWHDGILYCSFNNWNKEIYQNRWRSAPIKSSPLSFKYGIRDILWAFSLMTMIVYSTIVYTTDLHGTLYFAFYIVIYFLSKFITNKS